MNKNTSELLNFLINQNKKWNYKFYDILFYTNNNTNVDINAYKGNCGYLRLDKLEIDDNISENCYVYTWWEQLFWDERLKVVEEKILESFFDLKYHIKWKLEINDSIFYKLEILSEWNIKDYIWAKLKKYSEDLDEEFKILETIDDEMYSSLMKLRKEYDSIKIKALNCRDAIEKLEYNEQAEILNNEYKKTKEEFTSKNIEVKEKCCKYINILDNYCKDSFMYDLLFIIKWTIV